MTRPPLPLHTLVVLLLLLAGCQAQPSLATLQVERLPLRLPFGAPEAAPPSPEQAQQALSRSDLLRNGGQLDEALQALQPLLEHPDRSIAAEAGRRRALIALELGAPGEAAAVLDNLLGRTPQAADQEGLLLLRAVARKQAGDCPGAIGGIQEYLASSQALAAYARLQLAACLEQVGDDRAALAQTAQALQIGGPRLLRIEALEREAALLERAGDLDGALDRYEQLLNLGRSASYRAGLRASAARLYTALGNEAAAGDQLAAIVREAPGLASSALDQLVERNEVDRVSFFEAGLVRFLARDYEAGLRNFDGALAADGEAEARPAAAYYRAVSRVRLGEEAAGAAELATVADRFPSSRYAPDGLLRGGKIFESNGQLEAAAGAYRRISQEYPSSREGPDALFRLGMVNFLGGSVDLASGAWQQLAASDAPPGQRALAWLWQGKLAASSGDRATAEAHWRQAVALAPFSFGGLRARDLLEGNAQAQLKPVQLEPGRLELDGASLAELEGWLAGLGASLEPLRAELQADPALQRAGQLQLAGLKSWSSWELEELDERVGTDPARQAALALLARERGQYYRAILLAQGALTSVGLPASQAPAALRQLIYPLPYFDLLAGSSGRQGVDPLLLAALIRQESTFRPDARSPANALGLTQVVPSTGQGIAQALGRADFQEEDLLRPSTSLEFGAYYLGERLRSFGGRLIPALAAYNAGGGAVAGWLQQFGGDDPDLFAEQIPYAETSYYVKVVYENYGAYRALYGQP